MEKAISPAAVHAYLAAFPGDLICALQTWYEGLGGQGVPNPRQFSAINDALASAKGWCDAGDVRYEKFGVQRSYKRA